MTTVREPGLLLAEESGRRTRRWVVGAVVVVLVALAAAGVVIGRDGLLGLVQPRCRATALGKSVTFTPEQMHQAATITGIAMKRGLPARAATIAVATAIQESKLRNITYGDRDSLGLFQQRPSQGWGTREQILNPIHATNAFYDELVKVSGYQDLPITQVAQRVQRSAFPDAYAGHEQEGRIVASAISGHSPGGLGCRLDPPTGPTNEAKLQTAMQEELGVTGRREGDRMVVAARDRLQAWGIGAWAVAQAEAHRLTSVTVGDRQWTRTRNSSGWSWHRAGRPVSPTTVVLGLS